MYSYFILAEADLEKLDLHVLNFFGNLLAVKLRYLILRAGGIAIPFDILLTVKFRDLFKLVASPEPDSDVIKIYPIFHTGRGCLSLWHDRRFSSPIY